MLSCRTHSLPVCGPPFWLHIGIFTKVMVVVAVHLRRSEIPVLLYLHDWLLKARSSQIVLHHLQVMPSLLFDLGFYINVPRSHLEPSQRLLFIGAVLDATSL